MDYADSPFERALEILQYSKPLAWLIESSASGLLRAREVVKGAPHATIQYCKCGGQSSQPTQTLVMDIVHQWRPTCKPDCDAAVDGRHITWAQKCGSTCA